VYPALTAPATGVSVAPLAPTNHWNCNGDVPVAVTVNVAVPPGSTVWFCGCVEIASAVGDVGVSVAHACENVSAMTETHQRMHRRDRVAIDRLIGAWGGSRHSALASGS
jgi:hypothetical protein